MKKSLFFYEELTPAEVGNTGTHEIYVRLPNNFDYESFFNDTATENGSVLEVNFTAQDITDGANTIVPLRFVYFHNSNGEKRIPSLGSLFQQHNIQAGDIVCIESKIEGANTTYYIRFYKKGEIQISPNSIFYSRINDENRVQPVTYAGDKAFQQIFYGAPGTGKSRYIKDNEEVKIADGKNLVFRTTFHPDSDYSTFVGAYKPTMKPVADKYKAVAGRDEEITYDFIPQAFLQAYIAAWNNQEENVFLVIEEINRGNCAQIFGDLFQLLDRDDVGFSEYPIKADRDLAKYLNGKDEMGNDVLTNKDGIKNGKLKLPKNLYIWATMNTSDQSLFPIDSAFKRRWEWKYMPIANEGKGWTVEIGGNTYDWWTFLEAINKKIEDATYSEDKKLGYFFCKAKDGVIDAKTFVGKVLFYLWNDVFKDTDIVDSLLKDEDGKKSFDKFYTSVGQGNTEIVTSRVIELMKRVGVEPLTIDEGTNEEEDEDGNTPMSEGRNYDKFSVNGEGRYGKNRLPSECMKKYIDLHPDATIEQVYSEWKKLGDIVPHFVETKKEFDARTDNSKRSVEIACGDSVIYVAKNGYGSNGKVHEFITAVNNANWGITLAKETEE